MTPLLCENEEHDVVTSECKVDRLFAEWGRPDSPGCALGVIKDGQLVYKRGYGLADLEHDVPITTQTVFRIASTSKQFTAMCIALLAEQGKLSLDDDIREYLPDMPAYGYAITIRHLIHHTSGLLDYVELMNLAGRGPEDPCTDDDVIEMLAGQEELNFAPGSEYLYSNTGYYLLGLIVARASGQSLRQFAAEHIFGPLGMRHTHFHDDHTEIVRHRAIGYSPRQEGGYRIDMTAQDIVGDGGLLTTVEDLYLWDQNFYHNKLGKGKDSLIELVLTLGVLNSGEKLDYAFGLVVGDYRGLRIVSHGGGFVGFRAEMLRFPEQRFSVICLANLSTINPERLARQVADVYLADRYEVGYPDHRLIELPREALADKVGVYRCTTSGMIVELSLHDGKLMADADTLDESVQVAPIAETDFVTVAAPFDAQIKFEKPDRHRFWLMHVLVEGERPDTLEMIEVISPNADQLAEYVGDYCSEELQVTYRIVLERGKLYARYRNSPKDPLKPGFADMFWVGGTTFVFTRDFEKDRDDERIGGVTGFTVTTERVRRVRFVRNGWTRAGKRR
jgi:CubicO group peptidase (beta-lactamase class C family)